MTDTGDRTGQNEEPFLDLADGECPETGEETWLVVIDGEPSSCYHFGAAVKETTA